MEKGYVFVNNKEETNKKAGYAINLYDLNQKKIKEIYQYEISLEKMNLVNNFWKIEYFDKKIFIAKSETGKIEVFDCSGEKLFCIRLNYEKIKIPEIYKKRTLEEFKNKPNIKVLWDIIKRKYKLYFPEFFPPMKRFTISDNRIFIQTYKNRNKKDEFIIHDLKGIFLKRIFLPSVKFFAFYGNIFYYLQEKENEEWELFREEI